MKFNRAPFPYFGGKSKIAHIVWDYFGDIKNYVEPFFGSGAVLLSRPNYKPSFIETVNDLDGYLCNFWRAIKYDPEKVAFYADFPVSEIEQQARLRYLLKYKAVINEFLIEDPQKYNAKLAGYWVYGICTWIGSGYLKKYTKQLPYLGNPGRGIHGMRIYDKIYEWFEWLSSRLRRVRVTCGDWKRVCTPTVTYKLKKTGLFLDPPYSVKDRSTIYLKDSHNLNQDIEKYCLEHQDKMKIVLCGYEGEYNLPGWTKLKWPGNKGMAKNNNRYRERIWINVGTFEA